MKVFIALCIVVVCVVIFQYGRYLKTAYLIVRTIPYEQPGTTGSLLLLGDSTGYGTGVSKNTDSIAGRIGSDYPELTIKNNSVNGRTIGELCREVENVSGSYEVVLLQIGGNDILQNRDVRKVEKELRLLFEIIHLHTDQIIMMSTGDIGGAAAFSGEKAAALTARTLLFRDMFLRVSTEENVAYIDLYETAENDLFQKEPETYLALDGLHPSAAGYGLWYEKLRPVLMEKLEN